MQRGNIDLLCMPTTVTLTTRKSAAFSIPVFAGGNRAVLRKDAAAGAARCARGKAAATSRCGAARRRQNSWKTTSFAVVDGTATETWLEGRRAFLQIDAKITTVPDYRSGLQLLLDRKADVFFGERSLVLAAMDPAARDKLTIVDRLFTQRAGRARARAWR